jgi:aconitate hydratase
MDRHVIANMGAELGATSSVFPADEAVRSFLRGEDREADYVPLLAEPGASYDVADVIDLCELEPLIATPSSPGNVVPVREVAGEEVFQVVVGSSANPGLRDFAVVAGIVAGRQSHDQVSFDINPASRQTLEDLAKGGWLFDLIAAGARVHQSGCLGCIGMGQAPATGRNSLRTMPRNFPGRSGTSEDAVWLCSPETAAAAALTGVITDPRELPRLLGIGYPRLDLPERSHVNTSMLVAPVPPDQTRQEELVKGPNIASLPDFGPLPDRIEAAVELKVGDNISTDEILPAGAHVLPLRSNIPAISKFAFAHIDEEYAERAAAADGPHIVVAGENYGQGSSREHAVIAPRYLGLRAVIAKSFARIHWQNLANFGILPLQFDDPSDYDAVQAGDVLRLDDVRDNLAAGKPVTATHLGSGRDLLLTHQLSERQITMVLAGGRIPLSAHQQHTG